MCSVIGMFASNTVYHLRTLERLVHEASIRGLHSNGFSIRGIGEDVRQRTPITTLHNVEIEDVFRAIPDTPHFIILGHWRYTTSDPGYPQPLVFDHPKHGSHVIAMNGVISQGPPEEWPKPEDKCECAPTVWTTRNDTEIAMRFIFAGRAGLHGGSWAMGFMAEDGDACFIRNGDRPLWRWHKAEATPDDVLHVVASTRDILVRSQMAGAEPIPPFCQYRLMQDDIKPVPHLFHLGLPDLQPTEAYKPMTVAL